MCGFKGTRLDQYRALCYSKERLSTFTWLTGCKLPDFPVNSYDSLVSSYSRYANGLLHSLVADEEFFGMSIEVKLMLYRARRCFPPSVHLEDPLDFLSGYVEPITDAIYTASEIDSVLYRALKIKGNLVEKPRLSLKFSNKATLGHSRLAGGFNHEVSLWAAVKSEGPILPTPLGEKFSSPSEQCFAGYVARDHSAFIQAVNGSISFMQTSGRKPVAFVSIIEERSGKARVPTLSEGYCSILSQYASSIGKAVQTNLFPMTKDSTNPRLRSLPGGIYLSGDYKSSTDFAAWEPIWVAYYHIFRHAGMKGKELDIHMEIIKHLVGPHTFFSDTKERKRYQSMFKPGYVPDLSTKSSRKFAKMLNLSGWIGEHGLHGPVVGKQVAPGSDRGTLGILSESPALWRVWEMLKGFTPDCRTLTSIRGICMSYSLAAPALHILGAIPHWKFRGLAFVITGDDNASAHKNVESLEALEKEKLKTGMKPHDSVKSARGKFGVLIAEQLLRDTGERFLTRVKNFPIRILFPEYDDDWHAITMPAAAYRNFHEVPDPSIRLKILGFIYWKYKEIYDQIERLNVTVFGENGLFTSFDTPTGFLNSAGGLLSEDVFKRPQSSSQGPGDVQYHSGFLVKERLDVAHESACGLGFKPVTDTHAAFSNLVDATRANGPTSLFQGATMGTSSPPLLESIRSNIGREPDPPYRRRRWEADTLSVEGPDMFYGNPIDARPLSFNERMDADEWDYREIPFSTLSTTYLGGMSENIVESYELQSLIPLVELRGKIHSRVGFVKTDLGNHMMISRSSSSLYEKNSHEFVDVRNLFSEYRSKNSIPPLLKELWLKYLKCFGFPRAEVLWFCWEVPGETRFRGAGSATLVLACPKMVGHAGADLVFEHRVNAIRNWNPDATISYRSADKRWSRMGAQKL